MNHVTAHKCTFSQFQIKRDNEANCIKMLIQSSKVEKNQVGDMGRQTKPQGSAPQSGDAEHRPGCLVGTERMGDRLLTQLLTSDIMLGVTHLLESVSSPKGGIIIPPSGLF